MKKFSRIFGHITMIATIVIIVVFIGLFGPKLFGFSPYIATSGSMEPMIPTGSLVYVNTKDKDVEINDVITFKMATSGKMAEKTVTHRIIDKDQTGYITKGDANDTRDARTVEDSQIVGTYAYHLPVMGFVFDALGKKGLILIGVWILIINIFSIMLSLIAKDKKEKNINE